MQMRLGAWLCEALLPPASTPAGANVGHQGSSLKPGSVAWSGVRALKSLALCSNPSSAAHLPHLPHTCVMGIASAVYSLGLFEGSEDGQVFTSPAASAEWRLPLHTNLKGQVSPCNYL